MKKIILIIFHLLTFDLIAQQPWVKSSPSDYLWMNVGNSGFSAGQADYTSLAFSPTGEPYVAFQDGANSKKATVMKFDGTNWINAGNAGFSVGQADYSSLAFSPSGEPYVAFQDGANSQKSTVMKFDGTNWVNVGNAGFSGGWAAYTSLAFSPSGEPYVAFQDGQFNPYVRATVMKFDGSSWVNVGISCFSADGIQFTSLAFSPSGQPYVAFAPGPTVMKFDGTNWGNVGNPNFSGDYTYFTSLAFSPTGQPYVAFQDNDVGGSLKATVMKFDGNNWVYIGAKGFSAGEADYTSIAFSPSGQPYVAYRDYGNATKATVMKFDGLSWANVGNAGFSAEGAVYTSLAFSPSGQSYVAYRNWSSKNAMVMKYDSVYVGLSESQLSGLFLYPNPVTDKITVETSGIPTQSQLSIVDVHGQQIITRNLTEPKCNIDISNLPCGMYFMRLMDDRMLQFGKFIKQ
jgi:hypothetical protein